MVVARQHLTVEELKSCIDDGDDCHIDILNDDYSGVITTHLNGEPIVVDGCRISYRHEDDLVADLRRAGFRVDAESGSVYYD